MCGLFGIQRVTRGYDDRLAVLFGVLSAMMDTRGGHSFGFYADGVIKRGLGDFTATVPSRNLATVQTLMAHTRFATTGAVEEKNSHPLEAGTILGCHNGIVHNDWELDRKYKRNHPVDSHQIFQHIADGLPLKEIEAYGAITYLDSTKPDRIEAGRFHSGELTIAQLFDAKRLIGVAWSSTYGAMASAAGAAGLTFEAYKVEDDERYYLEDGEAYDRLEKFGISKGWDAKAYAGHTPSYVHTAGSAAWTRDSAGIWTADLGDKEDDNDDIPRSEVSTLGRCESCDQTEELFRYPPLNAWLCDECIDDWDKMDDEDAETKQLEAALGMTVTKTDTGYTVGSEAVNA